MKERSVLISVVIPMYNAEKYIQQCLNSVIEQTFHDYEVVVVNDGSKDASGTIADEYSMRYKNIKVIHQENAGVIKARKVGVANCNGDYVINLDSDDWFGKTHLEMIANEIKQNEPDIVFTGYTEVCEKRERVHHQKLLPGYYNKDSIDSYIIPNLMSISPFFSFGIRPTLWAMCVKREMIAESQVGMPESYSIGEDISISYPCLFKADDISIINDTQYFYRIQEESMTHVFDVHFSSKVLYLFEYLAKVLPVSTVLKRQFHDYVVFETCLLVSNYLGIQAKKMTYKENISNINKVMSNNIVKTAFKQFTINRKDVSLKWKIKVFLVKKEWYRIYQILMCIMKKK